MDDTIQTDARDVPESLDLSASILPSGDDETSTAAITIDPEVRDLMMTIDPTDGPNEITAAAEDPEEDRPVRDVCIMGEIVSVSLAIDRALGALSEPTRVTDDSLQALMRLSENLQSKKIFNAANRAFGARNDSFAKWLRDNRYDVSEVHARGNEIQWNQLRDQWHRETNRS